MGPRGPAPRTPGNRCGQCRHSDGRPPLTDGSFRCLWGQWDRHAKAQPRSAAKSGRRPAFKEYCHHPQSIGVRKAGEVLDSTCWRCRACVVAPWFPIPLRRFGALGDWGVRSSLQFCPPPPPLCDITSRCCFFTGPWTVTRSSLRMLRRVAALCPLLRPVLLLVLFPRSRSAVVGVPGLCWLRRVLFVRWWVPPPLPRLGIPFSLTSRSNHRAASKLPFNTDLHPRPARLGRSVWASGPQTYKYSTERENSGGPTRKGRLRVNRSEGSCRWPVPRLLQTRVGAGGGRSRVASTTSGLHRSPYEWHPLKRCHGAGSAGRAMPLAHDGLPRAPCVAPALQPCSPRPVRQCPLSGPRQQRTSSSTVLWAGTTGHGHAPPRAPASPILLIASPARVHGPAGARGTGDGQCGSTGLDRRRGLHWSATSGRGIARLRAPAGRWECSERSRGQVGSGAVAESLGGRISAAMQPSKQRNRESGSRITNS